MTETPKAPAKAPAKAAAPKARKTASAETESAGTLQDGLLTVEVGAVEKPARTVKHLYAATGTVHVTTHHAPESLAPRSEAARYRPTIVGIAEVTNGTHVSGLVPVVVVGTQILDLDSYLDLLEQGHREAEFKEGVEGAERRLLERIYAADANGSVTPANLRVQDFANPEEVRRELERLIVGYTPETHLALPYDVTYNFPVV